MDRTFYVDPAGRMGEPDFITTFTNMNDAMYGVMAEADLGFSCELNLLGGGDAAVDDIVAGSVVDVPVVINFVDRSPGWWDPIGAERDQYAYIGNHQIALNFRNLTINGFKGYTTGLTLLADFQSGAADALITVNGLSLTSGSIKYEAIGRVGKPATMTAIIKNQSVYDGFSGYKADATLGGATLNLSLLHCEHGAEAPCWFSRIGAGAVLNRTLKNYYAYNSPWTDTNTIPENTTHLPPTNVDCRNIFFEGYTGYGLDAQFGGSGHTEIDSAFPPICIVFPGHPSEDLRRRTTSPLLNAGTDAGVTEDFNGLPRTWNPTIGAYEITDIVHPTLIPSVNGDVPATGTVFAPSSARKNSAVKIRCPASSGFPIEVEIPSLNGTMRVPIAIGEAEVFRGDLSRITIYGVGGTAKADVFTVANI
jgi:hypothetical protein